MRSVCLFYFLLLLFFANPIQAQEAPYVIFYVDAPHLCYKDFKGLCDSLMQATRQKEAQGVRQFNVGHAWVGVHGELDGRMIDLTFGHSGEQGLQDRPYFQGVMDLVEAKNPNPISYLFTTLHDGFAQRGSGGHTPTYAVKRILTQEQLRSILYFLHPKRYPYSHYALTGRQCAWLVAQVAALAGCPIEHQVSVPIPSHMTYGGWRMRLWSDPFYRTIVFSSPDKIERSFKQLVESGQVEQIPFR